MEGIQLPVTITTQRLTSLRLDVYYPMAGIMDSMVAQKKINTSILNLVNEMIKEQGYYENHQTEITGSYQIKTNENGVLSLSLINFAYSGGAHGLTVVKSLTTDIETGKTYKLRDLFKPDLDYTKKLSDIIQGQIEKRDISLLGDFRGVAKEQDFYLADKSLVVYYQLYEIAPYVYGIPYFPISVYEIQDIINENGPLGRMMY